MFLTFFEIPEIQEQYITELVEQVEQIKTELRFLYTPKAPKKRFIELEMFMNKEVKIISRRSEGFEVKIASEKEVVVMKILF